MPKATTTIEKKARRAEADRVSAAWAQAADEVRSEFLAKDRDVGSPGDGATAADTGGMDDLAFMDAVEVRVRKILGQ